MIFFDLLASEPKGGKAQLKNLLHLSDQREAGKWLFPTRLGQKARPADLGPDVDPAAAARG